MTALLFSDGGEAISFEALAAQTRADTPREQRLEAASTPHALLGFHAALAQRRGVVLVDPRLGAEERGRLAATTREGTVVVFTSGSSGAPKGVVLSHAALTLAARAQAARLDLRAGDRWLLCLPWCHVGGLMVLMRGLVSRATVVVSPQAPFRAAAIRELLERHAITHVSLVPTQLARLVDDRPPPSLRTVLVGGSPCPPTLLAAAHTRGWPARAGYGLSEACALVALDGHLLETVEARLTPDGRIALRGPQLFDGYQGDEPRQAGDWFVTSDLGRMDGDGKVHVLGRADEMIVSGGEKIAPNEIEAALALHPAIQSACVFGVPDAHWGNRIAAVLEPVDAPLDADSLRAHLAPLLATFKRPRLVAWSAPATLATGLGKMTRQRRVETSRAYTDRLEPI